MKQIVAKYEIGETVSFKNDKTKEDKIIGLMLYNSKYFYQLEGYWRCQPSPAEPRWFEEEELINDPKEKYEQYSETEGFEV